MIEIIILIFLSRNIAKVASDKGHSGGLYRFLTFLFWFGFEILGAIIGLFIFGEGIMVYVTAIIFAIVGYLIIKNIADNLSSTNNSNVDNPI